MLVPKISISWSQTIMKKILSIIIVIIVNSSYFSYSQIKEIEISPFKVVQIITPGSYYHDDGADLIKYPKYEIRDTTGKVIVVVPESIKRHHTIKILPGEYFIRRCFRYSGFLLKIFVFLILFIKCRYFKRHKEIRNLKSAKYNFLKFTPIVYFGFYFMKTNNSHILN